MPEIRAGDKIQATQWPVSVTAQSDSEANISSTTFIGSQSPGGGNDLAEVGVTLIAPDSGTVVVALGAEMREQSTGNRLFVAPEVYEGTSAAGTLVLAATGNRGVTTSGDGGLYTTMGNFSVVYGLTPGATHYARVVYRTEGGTTNDIRHRRITVIPLP